MTLADQIHARLQSPDYALLVQEQRTDFVAWLSGLPEGRIDVLDELSPTDLAVALARIEGETDPPGWVEEWLSSRTRQHVEATFTPEMVTAVGEGWL